MPTKDQVADLGPSATRPVSRGNGGKATAQEGGQKSRRRNGGLQGALSGSLSDPSVEIPEPTVGSDDVGGTTSCQKGTDFHTQPSAGEASPAHRKNGDDHDAPVGEHPRLFSGISPSDYIGICHAARARQFNRGEMLHIEGDSVQRVLLLTSGAVKISKMSQGGGEVILRLRVPGDVLGVTGLFSCGMYCTTAQVFRTSRALVWEAQVFKDLVNRYPVLHQNMVAILGERLQELEGRFCEVATERVGPRVALQLLRLLKTIGRPGDGEVEIGLSREELGQMTGTTLFTVSRLLSAWEARGVVKPRREAVSICDVETLRAIAQEER